MDTARAVLALWNSQNESGEVNEIAFLALVTESRKRLIAALRQLRNTSKKCGCARCKITVLACRDSIKKASK